MFDTLRYTNVPQFSLNMFASEGQCTEINLI